MKLLPGEIILRESGGKRLVLTTHRLRFEYQGMGRAEIKSIMLEELASCALTRRTYPALIVLAALFALFGLMLVAQGAVSVLVLAAFAVSVMLVIIYLLNRPQILAFASAGTTIRLNTEGTRFELSKSFIDDTELAKNERYLLLKQAY